MPAAIYFQPEAYSTSGPKLMGRNSAGESFLRGYLRHGKPGEFWAQVEQVSHQPDFVRAVKASGRKEPVEFVDRTCLARLAQAGVLYFPAPSLGPLAWRRAALGHAGWSLCGITHTTASAGAMDGLTEMLTAPVQPWDALICTSRAVKDNVQRVWQAQADYLVQRLGVQRLVLPQLPVIPLGVHSEDFVFTEAQRASARAALGADEQTHVVLFFGRLSFHAKAHPLAMYQALEQAKRSLPAGQKVLLVECGRHANEPIERAFQEAAAVACPSVRVVTLDGRLPDSPRIAWAGADVFCSLSDNIQEAFGLTPLEAMAAGLPVVVSDWDGYKDTVRDGVDGFRIPTLMPAAGFGSDLALRHALEIDTYDIYCGHACSLVAVDITAVAAAFTRLFGSAELRARMGAAARLRVREEFDWKVIIPRYEALWASLTQLREAQSRTLQSPAHPWPARIDPFAAFAAYPTALLSEQTRLVLCDADEREAFQRFIRYRRLAMVNFAQAVLPTEAEVELVLAAAAVGPRPAAELIAAVAKERQAVVFRGLAWLVKLGILRQGA